MKMRDARVITYYSHSIITTSQVRLGRGTDCYYGLHTYLIFIGNIQIICPTARGRSGIILFFHRIFSYFYEIEYIEVFEEFSHYIEEG